MTDSPFSLPSELQAGDYQLISSVEAPEWVLDTVPTNAESLPPLGSSSGPDRSSITPSADPLDEIDLGDLDDVGDLVNDDESSKTLESLNPRSDSISKDVGDPPPGRLLLLGNQPNRERTVEDIYEPALKDLNVLRAASSALLRDVLQIAKNRGAFTAGTAELDDKIASNMAYTEVMLRAAKNTMSRTYHLRGVTSFRFARTANDDDLAASRRRVTPLSRMSPSPRSLVTPASRNTRHLHLPNLPFRPRAAFQSPPPSQTDSPSSERRWDTSSASLNVDGSTSWTSPALTRDSTSTSLFTTANEDEDEGEDEDEDNILDNETLLVAANLGMTHQDVVGGRLYAIPLVLMSLWVIVAVVGMILNRDVVSHPIWEQWRSR
uniref:Calcium-transporting ATPase (EC) n=1 Tax=Ganoderma boninense TaxID=34458 RepID=A0A5K1JTW5_9APHY|nr:Calcium-transporting ATPase (EC [Ganoderma boninense]